MADSESAGSWFSPYILLALAPILVVLVPWDFGPDYSTYRVVMAGHSLTVPVIQLLIYSILIRKNKMTLFRVSWLSTWDKLALLVLALCVAYTSFFVQIFSFAAVIGILAFYIHILFSLAVFRDMQTREHSALEKFWLALGIATFGYALLWFCGFMAYPPSTDDWTSLVPGVTNIRWTGFFWLAAFSAGLVFVSNGNSRTIVPAIIFGVFGLTMTIWTGSRGGLLAIVGSSAGVLLFAHCFRKFSLRYILITFTLSVSVSAVLPAPHPSYGLGRILGTTQSLEKLQNIDSGRVWLWTSTLQLVKDEPLAGHGIDQFQRMGPKETLGFKGPHSWPMQVLFSIGLLGALTLIYGVGRFLLLFRLNVEHSYQLSALAFFSGGSVYMLYDNFLYYTFPIAIYTISALMIFRLRSGNGAT